MTAPEKPKERQDWRERKRINAAARAAQVDAVAITTRIPSPPLPANDDEAGWRALICSLPGYDPYALGAGYDFEPEAAREPIEWIEQHVSHLEGEKAGQNFVLERWQRALLANLFGWLRPDGRRRFRECLIYLPKKSGKSALVRALVLYLFVKDDEPGSKVYCAAAKREQARIIWDACKLELARIDPPEAEASRFQHSIVKPDGGFLKPISADAGLEDGMNPHGFVLDELHRQPDSALVNMARLSSRTRAQPVLIYLTTADEDRESVCNDIWKRAVAVRSNPGDPNRPGFEPRFLPVVFQAEPEDDWTSPATWRKAAPCLGVTIQEEEYAEECRLAKENPALEADFKRYFLNLRTRSVVKAFDMPAWDACGAPFDPASLAGQECVAGIDLASTNDITALVLYFVKTGHVLPWFWVPKEAAKKRDKANDPLYLQWAACRPPLLTVTEGNQIDEERVLSEMLDAVAPFKVLEVAMDPANSLRYTQPLMRKGFKVVQVRQGWFTLSEPLKRLCTMIGAGKLRHGGHPVLRWMIGNAEIEKDIKENWTLVKSSGPEKIDGVSALVTAMARVLVQPESPPTPSVSLVEMTRPSRGNPEDDMSAWTE